MKVLSAPFMKELVIEFCDQTEHQAFSEILRNGCHVIKARDVQYDTEFQPIVDGLVAKLEGTVIYPDIRDIISEVIKRNH